MNKENNKLVLLTTANLYPRAVRALGFVGTSLVALASAVEELGWEYLTKPMVIIPMVVGLLTVLLTGVKPGELKKK